ncbi:MAG: hypothetical protein IT165_06285 [Bryobacterales bacterium]|nr:hypothetical protein [Bryobacterales bacterium]
MDSLIIQNAIGELDKILSQAKRALWEIGREIYVGYNEDAESQGGYADPRGALGANLEELHDILLVVLEAAQMPEASASLVKAWAEFMSSSDGLRHTDEDHEYQDCTSPAVTFVERLIKALRMTVSRQITSEQAWTLARLESMLRDTPVLVHRLGRPSPTREIDLQRVMHDYLSACFADYDPKPSISGTLKAFKPDCGVRSVRAAIEFKFIDTPEKAAVAFGGLAEDSAAYKGSKDWTRFYAVVYQTGPFMHESHLRSDMQRIGAVAWEPFVVNGFAATNTQSGDTYRVTRKNKR